MSDYPTSESLSAAQIVQNVAEVRQRVESAAEGRRVLLIAATKMNDAQRVRAAVAAGVDGCGENRVQELLQKLSESAYDGAAIHFIGHLQTNKVRQVVGRVDLIESVSSGELLRLISQRAESLGLRQEVLLEVNIGGEAQKSGFSPQELPAALEACASLSGLRVRGLMTVPPISPISGGNRPHFDRMRELFVDIAGKKYDNVSMDFLSMGMSADFEDAIRAGADLVRVGSAIFGARSYPPAHA
jgi:pyridoxal phosphate enzyme (YggS family)